MSVFNIILLIKDAAQRKQVRQKKIIKLAIYIAWAVSAFVFLIVAAQFSDYEETPPVYIAALLLFALLTVAYLVYGIYFGVFFQRLRKAQTFNPAVNEDMAFLVLNQKYDKFRKQTNIVNSIAIAVCAVSLVVMFVAAVLEEQQGFEAIAMWLISALGLAAGILLSFIFFLVNIIIFSGSVAQELLFLQDYVYRQEGLSEDKIALKKRRSFDAVAAQRIMGYMYPDEQLRKKMTRISLWGIVPGLLIGISMSLVYLSATSMYSVNLVPALIALSTLFILSFAAVAVLSAISAKLGHAQKAGFMAEPEKYRYHLQLHAENKRFRLLQGILLGGIMLAFYALGIVLCILSVSNAKLGAYALLALFAFSLVTMPTVLITSIYYNKKCVAICNQIEAHQAAQNVQQHNDLISGE